MQYEYSWNPGAPVRAALHKIDPTAFAEELEKIEREHGKVTSALLVDVAKPKDHIAHDFIYHVGERKAARLHYEQRAGLLLRVLVVRGVEETTPSVRARIAIPAEADDGGEGRDRFLSAQEVASRADLRDLHRKSLLRRMNLLRLELLDFDEFAEVVAAINNVLEDVA